MFSAADSTSDDANASGFDRSPNPEPSRPPMPRTTPPARRSVRTSRGLNNIALRCARLVTPRVGVPHSTRTRAGRSAPGHPYLDPNGPSGHQQPEPFFLARSLELMKLTIFFLIACSARLAAQARGEWPAYAGDAGATKYSVLADINRANASRLTVAWRWRVGEQAIARSESTKAARPGNFQATPLMIGDTLYFSTPYNRVVAMDASTGRPFWTYDPRAYAFGQPSNGTGFVHRGVATWTDGRHRRVFMNTR